MAGFGQAETFRIGVLAVLRRSSILNVMSSSDFDGWEAAGLLWKVGAGVALLLGLRALTHHEETKLDVTTSRRSYELDARTGSVTIPVRITAHHGAAWLHGCPRAPVLWVAEDHSAIASYWTTVKEQNRECQGAEEGPPVHLREDSTVTTYVTMSKPGRFRVTVPHGNNWEWGPSFTIRTAKPPT